MSAPFATPTPAAELREELEVLLAERAFARLEGLDANAAYEADLDDEILCTRVAYVGAAITEIASLRAEMDGPLQG